MHATKKKYVFLIYIFPTLVVGSNQHEIHFHQKEYKYVFGKYVFEKNNDNILLEH